jgi:site-specific recombinase XerD
MAKKNYFLPILAEFFSSYLPHTKGLSANTIRSYKHAFRLFLEFICKEKNLPPEKIEFKHLEKGVAESWLNQLATERNCSPKTRNQRLAALVTFARFALSKDFDSTLTFSSEIEHLPKAKVRKRDKTVHFSKEEMSILLRIPDSFSKIGKRNKTLLSTLYASGARAQELCDLTVGDVRFAEKTTLTLHGKGDKTRNVIIPEQSALLLKSYMEQFNLLGTDRNVRRHIFSSQTHEHMTSSCVEAIVKKYVEKAKQLRPDLFRDSYSPHSFRHSIAMHMLESGIPLPVIKTFLGHESIASTMIYASVNFEMVSKYLRDKDPYASQQNESFQLGGLVIPSFLK